MIEIFPYSALGSKSVYKGTNKKLNILGITVANP